MNSFEALQSQPALSWAILPANRTAYAAMRTSRARLLDTLGARSLCRQLMALPAPDSSPAPQLILKADLRLHRSTGIPDACSSTCTILSKPQQLLSCSWHSRPSCGCHSARATMMITGMPPHSLVYKWCRSVHKSWCIVQGWDWYGPRVTCIAASDSCTNLPITQSEPLSAGHAAL